MEKPTKEDRKLLTDFFMWMVENDFDHNIRVRVETKAELFLRDRNQKQQEPVSSVIKRKSKCDYCNDSGAAPFKTGDKCPLCQ